GRELDLLAADGQHTVLDLDLGGDDAVQGQLGQRVEEELAQGLFHAASQSSRFTRLGGRRPLTAATTFSAARTHMRARVAMEALAMWGERTTFGSLSRPGWTSGSRSKTSSPAAAIWPVASASARAASSTTGPREVFTSTAVFFMRANCAAPMRWRVCGSRGTWRLMKSAL